jgi:hypothetical protein
MGININPAETGYGKVEEMRNTGKLSVRAINFRSMELLNPHYFEM